MDEAQRSAWCRENGESAALSEAPEARLTAQQSRDAKVSAGGTTSPRQKALDEPRTGGNAVDVSGV